MLPYERGSNSFTYDDNFTIKKYGHNMQYYLEASADLLDAPEEWFYDKDTGKYISSEEYGQNWIYIFQFFLMICQTFKL